LTEHFAQRAIRRRTTYSIWTGFKMASVTDEWGFTETLANDTEQFRKYHNEAIAGLKTALDLYGDGQWGGDWKINAEDKEFGDKVYVRKTEKFGNVYALQAKLKADPQTIFRINWDNVDEAPKWNPTVKEFKIVTQLGNQSQLVTNATEAILGGLVSSRDFMDVRIWRKINDSICLSARSVQYDKVPAQKGRVRAENKVGLFRITPSEGPGPCEIVWMACMDLKGLLPKSVVERAMNSFLLDYVRYLRKFIETGH
jgi:hypothetical protein